MPRPSKRPRQDEALQPDTGNSTSLSEAHQECWQPILQADSTILTPTKRQLITGCVPYPEVLNTWETKQDDSTIFGARLLGDTQQPDHYVPVAILDLVTHSAWGAGRCTHTEMQRNGMNCILPVCTAPAIVRRVVQAIYSGSIELQADIEQMLVFANSIEVHHLPW